tara:strand:- start:277 stop:606 length:330 start_codon:yes stop_codon:yes gene_type:complete
MSVKLLLLKSGEQILADAKELRRKEDNISITDRVYGYLLSRPHKVVTTKPVVLTENVDENRNIQITLSPWILLTEDKLVTIPKDWVITIVDPIKSVLEMYSEKTNEQSN